MKFNKSLLIISLFGFFSLGSLLHAKKMNHKEMMEEKAEQMKDTGEEMIEAGEEMVEAGEEMEEMPMKKEIGKTLVINLLPLEMYKDCHIKGSINVFLDELEKYAKELDRNTQIVVYSQSYACHIGPEGWRKLKDMGFTNIKVYAGGTNEWVHAGYPSVGPCEFDYLKRPIIYKEQIDSVGTENEISKRELYDMMVKEGIMQPTLWERFTMMFR